MRKDKSHTTVVTALQKDGWKVTEQVFFPIEERAVWIDILAEKPTIEKNAEAIFVEVKNFDSHLSLVGQLHNAVGQYVIYRAVLR